MVDASDPDWLILLLPVSSEQLELCGSVPLMVKLCQLG